MKKPCWKSIRRNHHKDLFKARIRKDGKVVDWRLGTNREELRLWGLEQERAGRGVADVKNANEDQTLVFA